MQMQMQMEMQLWRLLGCPHTCIHYLIRETRCSQSNCSYDVATRRTLTMG